MHVCNWICFKCYEETEKTENNRVKACMSKVCVAALPDPDVPGNVIFHGDCDTSIIKGVVVLLVSKSW